MSLNASQIQTAFKILGKHIQLATIAAATVSQYQAHTMATIRQGVNTGVSGEYADFGKALQPLQASVDGFVQVAAGLPALAKTTIDNYLQQSLAVDLGLAAGSTSAAALAALVTQMAAATPAQTVATGGTFYTYFNTNYSVALAQSGSPTILDAWVTSSVV